jgi:hypothetical protein
LRLSMTLVNHSCTMQNLWSTILLCQVVEFFESKPFFCPLGVSPNNLFCDHNCKQFNYWNYIREWPTSLKHGFHVWKNK